MSAFDLIAGRRSLKRGELITRVLSNLHWLLTAAFLLALLPLFHRARLPLSIDLAEMAGAYWVGTCVRAVFCAVLLYVLCFPWSATVVPVWRRFRESKFLLLIELVVFLAMMIWFFGVFLGLQVVIGGIALAELMARRKEMFGAALGDLAIPASYLFIGIVVVFSFQHGIAGLKFAGAYDPFFKHLDRVIFHADVSQMSHAALAFLPGWAARIFEYAYYSLFMQIGGALVITAVAGGRKQALQYVATLLVGYYVALACFSLWPTIGPFSVCPTHYSEYPTSLRTFTIQETILAKARLLWQHNLVPGVRQVNLIDYYIGFPCMHVGLPLIAIWSLRKWRRMAVILIAYDLLLVTAIVVLEWHYLVDLVGGVVVAILAILVNRRNDT
jgi:hypothetical protein